MAGHLRVWALAGAAGLGLSVAATAQSQAPEAQPPTLFQDHGDRFTRDLIHEIRDLSGAVVEIGGTTTDLSGEVQGLIADSGGEIALRETDDSIILSVASDVLFDFDSAALSDPARDTLARIAAMLVANPGAPVQVVGHTDAKGSEEYNQTLSEERAASVVTFLTGNDVPAERLEPLGRGEAEPVAENEIDGVDNPDGRAQNRRVEFILPKN